MDVRLIARAAETGGYFTRAEAIDCGHVDRDLYAARAAGVIERLRHGVYAFTDDLRRLDPVARRRLVAYSVVDKLQGRVALCHASAAAVWELDLWPLPPEDVHVVRLDRTSGRREAGVIHHVNALEESDLVDVDGRLVVTPHRAAIETACDASVESAMVTLSSAQRRGDVPREVLVELTQQLRSWPGMRGAELALRLSDANLTTVGEVRSLYLIWRAGLPMPRLQVELHDSRGRLVGRVDFDWEEFFHCGEFDGLVKYGRLNTGLDQGRVLVEEKRREDRIREAGPRGMTRWGWDGLDGAGGIDTIRRLREGFERSKRLFDRGRVVIA